MVHVGQNMKLSLNTVRVTVRSGQDVFLRAGAIMGCNLSDYIWRCKRHRLNCTDLDTHYRHTLWN